MTDGPARQRGFALLIVLWTLGLLALLGTQLLASSRQDAQLARNLLDAAKLEAAANGAVQRAIFNLLDSSGRGWRADGTVRLVRVGETPVAVQIDDEADKVNPSVASATLMQALMQQVGADPVQAAAVAGSIVEWRLASGSASRPGAATARYASAGRDYAPSGVAFESIGELGNVLGMTPNLLALLRPHLTVFTDSDPPMTTRDPVVALALAAAGQRDADAGETGTGLVSVTADAQGQGHARYRVHVVVRLNAQPEGRRYETLAYERPAE